MHRDVFNQVCSSAEHYGSAWQGASQVGACTAFFLVHSVQLFIWDSVISIRTDILLDSPYVTSIIGLDEDQRVHTADIYRIITSKLFIMW